MALSDVTTFSEHRAARHGVFPPGAPSSNDGDLDAVLDDAFTDGIAGDAGGVVEVELAHEVFAMLLDRLDADPEIGRDLLVGAALGDELKGFHLTGGEQHRLGGGASRTAANAWVEPFLSAGDRRTEMRPSLMHLADGPAEVAG